MDRDLLERVLNISRKMAETRTLDPLLSYTMDEAIDLAGAERGYIVLVEADGKMDVRVQRGQDGEDLSDPHDQFSKSILANVVSGGQPLIVRDATNDPKFSLSKSVVNLKIRSVMCVPLIARGETIGAIYVENRSIMGRFSDDALPPLLFFANQAAVMIENAALNDQLEARVAERTRELEDALTYLEQSWTETIEANRLRTLLLGNVAHDLRAPLSIVVGALTMMLEGNFGKLQPEQADWISKSLDASNYVLKLTNDVFDLVKLELHRLELFPEQINLNALLKNIFEIAQGLPWPETVTLHMNIRSELPLTVTWDPVRIRQVMLNLLSNALKFTAEGTVTIHAEYLAAEDQVLLGVADTGEGIPAEAITRLFERFQQIDTDRNRRGGGAGLGLAICRDLVEMHNGHIWAESKLGVGSDFKFVLPLTMQIPTQVE